MVVDRDLNRDSLDFLHELDRNTRISKKKNGTKQHTEEDSNSFRLMKRFAG